jgi:hypothetical protein
VVVVVVVVEGELAQPETNAIARARSVKVIRLVFIILKYGRGG